MSVTIVINVHVTVMDDAKLKNVKGRVAGLGLKPEFLLMVESRDVMSTSATQCDLRLSAKTRSYAATSRLIKAARLCCQNIW